MNYIELKRIIKAHLEKTAILTQRWNKKKKRREYALISKKKPGKVLQWFGLKKPSTEAVEKVDKRIRFFKHKN